MKFKIPVECRIPAAYGVSRNFLRKKCRKSVHHHVQYPSSSVKYSRCQCPCTIGTLYGLSDI